MLMAGAVNTLKTVFCNVLSLRCLSHIHMEITNSLICECSKQEVMDKFGRSHYLNCTLNHKIANKGSVDEIEKVKDATLGHFNIWSSGRGRSFRNEIQREQLKWSKNWVSLILGLVHRKEYFKNKGVIKGVS